MASDFNLGQFMPYIMAVVSERVSHRLSVDYGRTHDLTMSEWRVMVHLARCGTVSVRDIQRYTNLEKSRVSRAVVRLETAGLVVKSASQTDARLVAIELTDEGHAALDMILPAAKEVETRLLQGLAEEDLETFYRVVAHIHAVLDADPDAKPRPFEEDAT